uniref:Uncharacterized protein n=1 Tax=viral metagenome TaxID=1070528 RepID=A0A6C0JHF9_9ZZZZ
MVKQGFNKYIIIALLLILLLNLFYYIYNRSLEGLENQDQDDFVVALNVVLSNKNGVLVPSPHGSFKLTTESEVIKKEIDFSMNDVASVKTTGYRDISDNLVDRTVTIVPINTNNVDPTGNTGDVIPNHFTLDVSFNQNVYKLDTLSEIKSINALEKDKTKHLPIVFLNAIDDYGVLNIKAIGPVYDSEKKSIGKVTLDSMDSNNEKSFQIKVDIPTDPKNIIKDYIKKIKITFKKPAGMMNNLNLPEPPPPISQSAINRLPRP